MKSALCLSGQPRYLLRGHEHIYTNIIEPNNCDIFIHCWESDVSSEEIIDLYHPKLFQQDPQIYFDVMRYNAGPYSDGPNYKRVFNIHSMYYSIYRANELRKNYENIVGFKYDAVARCRFDWGVHNKIDFQKLDLNKINTYNDCTHEDGCVTDHFAVSNSINMNIYCKAFFGLPLVYNPSDGGWFCSEILLGRWLKLNNRSVEHIPLEIRPLCVK